MTSLAAPTVGVWTPLGDASGGAGYLSVYLSESLARYPIRHITKEADNKSDPNIETGTYGLFSTCESPMRRKIVREGRRYLFFVTSHRARNRALTGYYILTWFAESTGGAMVGDFALAATEMRFIEPVPLDALPEPARKVCVPMFRTIRPVNDSIAKVLHGIIRSRPDITERYLSELRRVEQFARYHSGYAYLLGIRLSPDATVPDELMERGAEILKWYDPEDVHEFQDAIERAATAVRSTLAMPTNSASTCAR